MYKIACQTEWQFDKQIWLKYVFDNVIMHVKVNDGLAYLSIVSACDDSGPSHKKNWRQSGQRQDFENADQSGLCH